MLCRCKLQGARHYLLYIPKKKKKVKKERERERKNALLTSPCSQFPQCNQSQYQEYHRGRERAVDGV
jgi:hypothetical protein